MSHPWLRKVASIGDTNVKKNTTNVKNMPGLRSTPAVSRARSNDDHLKAAIGTSCTDEILRIPE
jgi:hypothetical protein